MMQVKEETRRREAARKAGTNAHRNQRRRLAPFRYKHMAISFLVTCLVLSHALAFSPRSFLQSKSLRNRAQLRESQDASLETNSPSVSSSSSSSKSHLVFPGGGIFFYWQAGVVCYLREEGYDLDGTTMAGASAGALTATLTASRVDFYDATSLALDLAAQEGVWDRRGGLQGVWGPMIERWLEDVLPPNVIDLVDGRLTLLVTPIPSFGKSRVSKFINKNDLIRCNMASVHLPLFLDSKFTSMFREQPHIDGSFLAGPNDYLPEGKSEPKSVLVLNWQSDPAMEGKALEFVSTYSRDAVWGLLEQGKSFARIMDERGDFQSLDRIS